MDFTLRLLIHVSQESFGPAASPSVKLGRVWRFKIRLIGYEANSAFLFILLQFTHIGKKNKQNNTKRHLIMSLMLGEISRRSRSCCNSFIRV